jgi:hypothetical protein
MILTPDDTEWRQHRSEGDKIRQEECTADCLHAGATTAAERGIAVLGQWKSASLYEDTKGKTSNFFQPQFR